MTLLQGARLGPYEIRAVLGVGGMGEVYRAHDPRLGRDIAIKILPEAMAKDPEGLARFTREARAVAALSHPHIVTIFSTEEADGVRFMTMELIEGRALDRMIPEGGLSLAQFFDVSTALADALSAAHLKQITHRDLKPGNVMVADDGRVKVLDFGLARDGESESSSALDIEDRATRLRLTKAGTILGTMPYMSPEQIEAKPLDARSDIFSLGIVMYEMATGARPFHGDTSPALMASIMKDHPRLASELRPDVPGEVSRVVARCLEKNPRDRVQSAHEILLELKALRRAWEAGAFEAHPKAGLDPRLTRETARPSSRAVAMLVTPFTIHGADFDMEALARGLGDDIATGLSKFPSLTVLSSKESEARYRLEGSVRRSGDAVRASFRLVDSDTGAHLWAENYDRSLQERSLFDLQDDLTSHVVATIADGGGVLVRSMAAAVKDRPVEELAVSELVLRYIAYTQHFRPEEHFRLRAGLENALTGQQGHAPGWACLSSLYDHEFSMGLNPRPDPRARSMEAAERSVEIDPTCQAGWRQLATLHFFARDLNGLRMAAERGIPLNPLNSSTVAYIAMILAYSGDWEAGIPMVRKAMGLNPQHPGWFHSVLFNDHYRKREYEEALTHAKRANMPQYVWTPLSVAIAAGQLGRGADARAALDGLQKNHPDYLKREKVSDFLTVWHWDEELVERLLAGFDKALALVAKDPQGSLSPVAAG